MKYRYYYLRNLIKFDITRELGYVQIPNYAKRVSFDCLYQDTDWPDNTGMTDCMHIL